MGLFCSSSALPRRITGFRHSLGVDSTPLILGSLPKFMSTVSDKKEDTPPPPSLYQRFQNFMHIDNIRAGDEYNRWLNVPAGALVNISVGSIYAWSLYNEPITRELGVITASSGDWALPSVVPIFSMLALSFGITTGTLGGWAERSGPRKVAAAGGLAFGTGMAAAGVGCMLHSLPLVYMGWGVLGGIGWGLGYMSPVSTMMKWFPDRRGMATGMALTTFGAGGLVATPLSSALIGYFQKLPTRLGSADEVTMVMQDGARYVETAQGLKEVVVATVSDLATIPGAVEGVYLVGTGSTGVAPCFLALGAIYFTSMFTGAMLQRVPREGWRPEGYVPPGEAPEPPATSSSSPSHADKVSALITRANVSCAQAMKTPQFWMIWTAVGAYAVAGVSVIAVGKTIMGDTFGRAMPELVTASFAASYVAALSAANASGRLGYAYFSDYVGRKRTYTMFGAIAPLCLVAPHLMETVGGPAVGATPLVLFYGGSLLVVSFYGGLFSVLPAYLADVFGLKEVGAIHGRALTAWAGAAIAGPNLLTWLRQSSYDRAMADIAALCDPVAFQRAFGAPLAELPVLVEAKTVTLARLLEIAPPGTPDPTPLLYNSTMYAMAGIASVALLANSCVRPVHPKHHMKEVPSVVAAGAAGVVGVNNNNTQLVVMSKAKESSLKNNKSSDKAE